MELLLLDGNSLVNRAFFAVKGLSSSSGFPTNAIFGLYNILDKILKERCYTHVVAAFDLKAPTFRHKEYLLYKANRKGMPYELLVQLEHVKKMLEFMGINICEIEGFEADDVIGSISAFFSSNNIKTVIATGDRDSFQLINENVSVRLSKNNQAIYYDESKIFDEFAINPKDFIEVKALMGDASDNIPGVKGVGEKTALKLIREYKTVDYIYSNINNINISSRLKSLLLAEGAKDMCFLSRRLGQIRLDAPTERDINYYARKAVDYKNLVCFLKEFELNKILNNLLNDEDYKKYNANSNSYNVVKNPDFEYVLKLLEPEVYLDFYIKGSLYIFAKDNIFEYTEEFKRDAFYNIISKSCKKKRTTDLKDLYNFCYKEGLSLNFVVFSCDIAAYIVDVLDNDFSIDSLALKYAFNCSLPGCFLDIIKALETKICSEKLNFLFENVELPLAKVLSQMENSGFYIDIKELDNFCKFLEQDIDYLKKEIYEFCGAEFNINSTKELAFILFDKLGLKKGKKTKTGYSTDMDVLQKLVKYNPSVSKIIDYRLKSKLMNTYVVGLKRLIRDDGRIYSHFNQTKTRTGRISSTEPNIQNIPVRTELGASMRKFFKAKDCNVLIDADYSQIELRILASLSEDESMLKTLNSGGDIHELTAKNIFGFISKETRRRAKTVNFSVLYGVSAFSLGKDIGVSTRQAKLYIDSFFNLYIGVKRYFDYILEKAQETGRVYTLFGRYRSLPELNSNNKNVVELGKRIAKNTPIQGTAADIIKIAMIKVVDRLKKENLEAKLILQVHDELLVETPLKNAEYVANLVKEEMQGAVKLKVPLACSVGIGKTWYDAKS